MKILIFSAHMDDETIGLGGYILREVSKGNEVKVVSLCNGRRYQTQKRTEAFESIMTKIGCEYKHYSIFDTTLYKENITYITGIVFDEIYDFQPDIVFSPSQYDLHQDHKFLAECVKIGIRKTEVKKLYQYKIPKSGDITQPQIFETRFDISEFIEQKLELLKEYTTEDISLHYIYTVNSIDGFPTHVECAKLIFSKE